MRLRSLLLGTSLAFLTLAVRANAEAVDYRRDIKPILSARCYACHGVLAQKAKLRLDTAALMRKGGKNGPVLVPGKSAASLLIVAVVGEGRPRMPPEKEGPGLTPRQIALLKAWIDQGAKAPDEQPEDLQHWAFQKPVRVPLPRPANDAWRRPIDAFIAAAHEKAGLQPRPLAGKETLLRRVYLDLIGLPPTPEELQAFLDDSSPGAYEKVVDRLLGSPEHGERWARHWMDVWRYSDWYGRRAVPDVWNSAPQIWRWRDWIVDSLNKDKGYDRMLMEMLAADEIAPEDEEAGYATGYLVRNWYALNPNQWKRDIVEHTGKAFLGLTLHCAHCHDHKYDPISQEEYFRFRAFFEPLGLRQDRVQGEADPGPFQKYEYSVLRKVVQLGSVRVFDEFPQAKTLMYQLGDEREVMKDKASVSPGAPAFLGGTLAIAPVSLPTPASYPGLKTWLRQEELQKHEALVKVAETELARARTELVVATMTLREAQLTRAQAVLASVKARLAADAARYGLGKENVEALAGEAFKAERLANFRVAEERHLQLTQDLAVIKTKGNAAAIQAAEKALAQQTQVVTTAKKTLESVGTQYTPFAPTYPTTSTGRRRALALWIAHRDNPLTARVAVNHLWKHYFQRPLVESVADFGRNGKKPSHPELLDWLAVELMDSGWSMKRLHRLIVTSNVYRLQPGAGEPNNPKLEIDPDNRLLWHFNPRRMEAEIVRDSLLYVAGELDLKRGGIPLDNQKDLASRRRSLYFSVFPEGGGHMPFLTLFDPPDPCDCYQRSESIVPQQALALTNSELALTNSRLLARKISGHLDDKANAEQADARFITLAFAHVLSRKPTSQEEELCRAFLRKQRELFVKSGLKPGSPSGMGPSSDPVLRARESLVRVLFNHDDFVTIR